MKTKKQIQTDIINIIRNNGGSIKTNNKIYDYVYSLQRNQRQTIDDLHQAANVIAAKYIAHPRVNTKISKFADNENPHYQTQVWDGAQHIMSLLHQDPQNVLQSFENACKIRWGKPIIKPSVSVIGGINHVPNVFKKGLTSTHDFKASLPYPTLVQAKPKASTANDSLLFSCI